MAVIALLRGPQQWLRGIAFYEVLRGAREADLLVVSETDNELLFAGGTTLVDAFRVETVRHWDDKVSSGVVRFAFVAARADVDATTFRHRYEAHAAIAHEQHPAICRYVQHFVRHGTDRDVAAISELHFDDETSMRENFYRDANSAAVVEADISDYLDRDRTWSLVTRPGPESPSPTRGEHPRLPWGLGKWLGRAGGRR
jgi:hypothetical protein